MRARREPAEAAQLIARLRERHPTPEWALFPEVRSSVGADLEELRRADALAVRTWGPVDQWTIKGFEVKRFRSDALAELGRPAKAALFQRFCATWAWVVPAPWTDILLSVDELPEGVGLIEIGPGAPTRVVRPTRRRAEPPTPGLLKALLRVGAELVERLERDDFVIGAPLVPISRHLSGTHVALVCMHVVPAPKLKKMPRALPCFACLDGLPTERQAVLAALADASPADLAAYLEAIDLRAARTLPDPDAAVDLKGA